MTPETASTTSDSPTNSVTSPGNSAPPQFSVLNMLRSPVAATLLGLGSLGGFGTLFYMNASAEIEARNQISSKLVDLALRIEDYSAFVEKQMKNSTPEGEIEIKLRGQELYIQTVSLPIDQNHFDGNPFVRNEYPSAFKPAVLRLCESFREIARRDELSGRFESAEYWRDKCTNLDLVIIGYYSGKLSLDASLKGKS